MRFVSVDVSTKFLAYALWDGVELVEFGKIYPQGTSDQAVGSFTGAVIDAFENQEVERLVYESAFLGKNVNVVKGLSKTTGAMIGGFYEVGVRDFIAVPPITWQTGINVGRTKPADMALLRKKYPTRSTTWIKNRDRENRKQLVIDFVNLHYKLDLKMEDNDLADAIGLGHYALARSGELDRIVEA